MRGWLSLSVLRVPILAILLAALAACGGSSGSAGREPPPVNAPPTITGTPPTVVTVGEQYFFAPSAQDADNDTLTFSITGQPPWATFDTSTGELQGTPADEDEGIHGDIVISVSDGRARSSLPAFAVTVEPAGPQPAAFGLDARPANPACVAVDPPNDATVAFLRAFPDMSFTGNALTAVTQAPGLDDAWYFATREGIVGRFDNDPAADAYTTVIDLSTTIIVVTDGGLIQLVFHPDFPNDRRFFVNYSAPPSNGTSTADVVVSSFELSADGLTADPASEIEVIRYTRERYHQGGFIKFAADGNLLIGFGDGTVQGDWGGRAQDLSELRGKIIRVNVDSGAPYTVPADNPFIDDPGALDEIFAYGLRNPWRGDVDPVTGTVFVTDIGYKEREEVNELIGGENFGWNRREGTTCFSEDHGSCDDPTLVDPLIEYDHSDGNCAIIGGYFYRGQAITALAGKYLFTDYCTGKLSAVDFDNDGNPYEMLLLAGGAGPSFITTFAKDNSGELYVVTSSEIHKLVPGNALPGQEGPATQLSATGCFEASDPTQPSEGLIYFDLHAPLWSDGATKRRWMALPDGQTIDIDQEGDFLFPDGTVLVKEFAVDGEPIETRLLMKDLTGRWSGYSYEWSGADATLLPAGKQKTLPNGQVWSYPSRGECLRCHTGGANVSLGPEISQLNGDIVYEETYRISNQLATMQHIGLFTNGLPDTPDQLPALAGLADDHQAISRRARSYLHSNCSGCHQGLGATQSNMDLRFTASRTDMNVCNIAPSFGDLGIVGAQLVMPGSPELSILPTRPARTSPLERMPPLGTAIVDDEAIAVLNSWIQSPDVCAVESDGDLDMVPDDEDNCPSDSNPDQADSDRDGIGNVCDSD